MLSRAEITRRIANEDGIPMGVGGAMTEYLTPAEVEEWAHYMDNDAPKGPEYAATLREMAAVVAGVAESEVFDLDDTCVFCGAYLGSEHPEYMAGGHSSDCLYLRARRLRGPTC